MTATLPATPTLPAALPLFDARQVRAAVVEDIDTDQGTILVRAVPYGVEVQLERELWESFAPGAFAAAANPGAAHRTKLYHGHSTTGGVIIGCAKVVEDRPDGVWVRAAFSTTAAAGEARELAADGTLDQVSVEFRAPADGYKVTRRRDGLHVRHYHGHLLGVALVPHGAYGDSAFVASVRDIEADHRRERAIAHLRSLQA